jgi:5-methylcytosine-specific restriction endonuclease McrA
MGKYCSNRCQKDAESLARFERFLAGETKVYSSPPALRRAVIRRDGYRCSSCLNSEWVGKPIPLELEHKDGNSGNDASDNLCMLCPNCHALTPTYKVKNKGNGRHTRRVRYAEGKSF